MTPQASRVLQHVAWRQGALNGTWADAQFDGDLLRVQGQESLEFQKPVQLRLMLSNGDWLTSIAVLSEDAPQGELHMTLALDPDQRDRLLSKTPAPAHVPPPLPPRRDPLNIAAFVLLGLTVSGLAVTAVLMLRG